MQRTAFALSLCFVLTLTPCSSAQNDNTPHLDLVRGLRERGYHDLALAYLEHLQLQQATLGLEVKAALPLELARSRAEVATTTPAGAERDRLLQRSRTDLEAFLRSNPSPGLAAECSQALANCVAEQARSLASSTERAGIVAANPPKAAKDLQAQTIARFNEADRLFAGLQKQLEDQLGIKATPEKTPTKGGVPNPPKSSPLYLSTLYYRAQARYDLSRLAGLGVRESGLANDEARQLAEKLSVYRGVSSAGWQGYALFARTLEGADDAKANLIYRAIDQANTPNAQAAQRAMRYYPLARADASGEMTDRGPERDRLKAQAERWLQLYGVIAGNNRDAQHVRYMLIRILAKELEEIPENRRQSADAQTRLDRVLALIDSMDNGKAENQDALERLKYTMLRLSGRAKGPLESLKTFDEALLRASIEFYTQQGLEAKLKEVGNTVARTDVEAQFKKQVEATLAALRRTQSLMLDANVSERNRVRILNMQQSCLRRLNDGPRAAILCEYLATTARQPEIAQSAAAEALRLYQFLSREGGKTDSVASAHMMAMAQLLDQRFPDSPQADEARSILGRDLIAKRNFDGAIAMLTKVKANPGMSRYLAGLAAWSKHRDLHKDKLSTKSAESTRALALLNECVAAFAQQKSKDELEQRAEVQAALLILGIHDTLGETDAVIATAQPLLTRIEQKQMPNGLAASTEMQVLDTVMSAYIQKRDLQAGPAKLLAILNKRKDDPKLGDTTRFLQSAALRIKQQLDEYLKQGEPAKLQYQATRDSYRQFLDQIEKDPKLPLKQRVWLGSSFSGIGDYSRASRVLSNITAPPSDPNKKPSDTPDETTQLYRQAVSLRISALRQAALSEPDANDRDKALASVEKELQKVMTEPWAKRNPALIRDEIYLQQLRGNYSGKTGAITRWDQFRTVVRPLMDKNDSMKELYWEANYNLALCIYLEAQILKNPESRQKGIDRAASVIIEAQHSNFGTSTQAGKFRNLLANPKYTDLKQAFDRLTGTPPSSGNTNSKTQ